MKPTDCPCGFTTNSFRAKKAHRETCTWRPKLSPRTHAALMAVGMVSSPLPEVPAPSTDLTESLRARLAKDQNAREIGPGVFVIRKSK